MVFATNRLSLFRIAACGRLKVPGPPTTTPVASSQARSRDKAGPFAWGCVTASQSPSIDSRVACVTSASPLARSCPSARRARRRPLPPRGRRDEPGSGECVPKDDARASGGRRDQWSAVAPHAPRPPQVGVRDRLAGRLAARRRERQPHEHPVVVPVRDDQAFRHLRRHQSPSAHDESLIGRRPRVPRRITKCGCPPAWARGAFQAWRRHGFGHEAQSRP